MLDKIQYVSQHNNWAARWMRENQDSIPDVARRFSSSIQGPGSLRGPSVGTGTVLSRSEGQNCEVESSPPSTAKVNIGGDSPPPHKTFSRCGAQLINCMHCIDFHRYFFFGA
jgi:hypothetical protein